MKNIIVIIKKQIKDTIKNKTVLIQFILFPILTIIMENAIKMDGMPEMFFTKLFSIMYIGMAPLTAMAAIISEEKEKNTLRVLMMANVKPWQYLVGVGVYVWTEKAFRLICSSWELALFFPYLQAHAWEYILRVRWFPPQWSCL